MKALTAIITFIAATAATMFDASAQNPNAPGEPRFASGEVEKVDAAASAVIVRIREPSKKGAGYAFSKRTFKVTTDTVIVAAKGKQLADVEDGSGVSVTYTGKDPDFVATSISVLWRSVPPPSRPLDLLVLPGEEPINGRFAGWTDGGVRWELPAGGKAADFRRPTHGAVRFASQPGAAPAPRWTVRLTNGDVLVGDALTLDAVQLSLATATLGKLQVPRALVVAVQQGPLRDGFLGRQWLGEWNRVSYGNESYTKFPTVYQDVHLPDRVAVDLTLPPATEAKPEFVSVRLFTDPADPSVSNDNGYFAQINRKVGVQLAGGHGWSKTVRLDSPRASVTVGLRFDRKTGEAQVLVDGEVKQREMLLPVPDNCKRGLLIRADELPDLVTVKSWAGAGEKAVPWVQFTNGDTIDGAIESITAGKAVVMAADVGRLEVPLERLAGVTQDSAFRDEAELRAGTVAAGLSGGGCIVGTLIEMTEARLTLDSAWGGKITIPRAALTWLRWGWDKPLSLAMP